MYIVIVAWLYVVLMMALAEALSSQGTVLGAVFTVLLYGVLPLAIVVYIIGTPARKRALRAAEAAAAVEASDGRRDGSGNATAGAIAPERKEG
jgi:hypothetical protein